MSELTPREQNLVDIYERRLKQARAEAAAAVQAFDKFGECNDSCKTRHGPGRECNCGYADVKSLLCGGTAGGELLKRLEKLEAVREAAYSIAHWLTTRGIANASSELERLRAALDALQDKS